jgi:hypothetical protein
MEIIMTPVNHPGAHIHKAAKGMISKKKYNELLLKTIKNKIHIITST